MTVETTPTLTKTIRVTGLDAPGAVERVTTALAAVGGVREVGPVTTRGVVRITYDPRDVRLAILEDELATLGHRLSTGWLDRLRRAWHHFSEQNVIDNLNHEGHCCAKPPKGA